MWRSKEAAKIVIESHPFFKLRLIRHSVDIDLRRWWDKMSHGLYNRLLVSRNEVSIRLNRKSATEGGSLLTSTVFPLQRSRTLIRSNRFIKWVRIDPIMCTRQATCSNHLMAILLGLESLMEMAQGKKVLLSGRKKLQQMAQSKTRVAQKLSRSVRFWEGLSSGWLRTLHKKPLSNRTPSS